MCVTQLGYLRIPLSARSRNPFSSCCKVSNISKTDENNKSCDSKKMQENKKNDWI
jgi:hypothetical protein